MSTIGPTRVGIATLDCDLIIRSWDPWLSQATGRTESEARGASLPALFPEVAQRGHVERLRAVVSRGEVVVLSAALHGFFLSCKTRQPSTHFTQMQQHVILEPLREGADITGVVVTVEDVTENRDRERTLAGQLRDGSEPERLSAAKSLAADPDTAGSLTAGLSDDSWRVRRVVTEGIAQHPSAPALAALIDVLRSNHRDLGALNAALSTLALVRADPLPAVIELLESEDAEARTYAALALGQIRDARAVPPLLERLSDPDINVRYHAIEAMGRIGAREAAHELAVVAASGDFFLSFIALDALAEIGEPSAATGLLPLLSDEMLRPAVINALGSIGGEEAVAPLAELINGPGPVAESALAIARLHTRLAASLGVPLIAQITRERITAAGARALIDVVFQARDADLAPLILVLGWLEAEGVDQALARLLARDSARDAASEALAQRGDSALPVLIDACTSEDEAVRAQAARALGRVGNPLAVPSLLKLLDAGPDAALAAANALGSIGDPRAFHPLLTLLDHPDGPVRNAAVGAINSIGLADTGDAIGRLLTHSSARVRESAVRIVGYFGYAESLGDVLDLCQDPDASVRRAAIEHLPYFDDPHVAARLSVALLEDEALVRAAAARALAQVPKEIAAPLLLRALADKDAWVVIFSARSAGRLGVAEAVAPLVEIARSERAPHVRIAAMEALAELHAPQAVSVLAGAAESSEPDVARAATDALGRISLSEATDVLIGMLGVQDAPRLTWVVDSLARYAPLDAADAMLALAANHPPPELSGIVIAALVRIGTRAAISALVTLTRNVDLSDAVVKGLSGLSVQQSNWLGEELLNPDESVRCAVVEALSRMHHPHIARMLAPALDDRAASVRQAALHAMTRLDIRQAHRS